MRYEEARSIRDYALFLEERNQPGLARDHFNQAYILFEKCGAALETSRIEDKVDNELIKHCKEPELTNDTSTGSFEAADQIRLDTLYDASLQLARNDTIDTLLRQTVHSLIKATGAQYGLLHLDGDEFHEPREMVLNFEDHELTREAISFSTGVIARTRTERRIVTSREDHAPGPDSDTSNEHQGSALCVPLLRGEKYYGCVYLTNTLVTGLFSESASKAAQIIAGQASFLIENMYLMEEYKRLNVRLEQKVKEQTSDIREKNEQLSSSNLKLIESERMKDILSGGIVHDLKNHIFSISSNNRALTRFTGGNHEMESIVKDTAAICDSAMNLSINILEIHKMEEGRLTLQQRQMYFEELAAIAQKFGRNVLFNEKKISVTISAPKRDFAVMADPYLVERVIQNLFSNAAKYTSAGGSVGLAFEQTTGENIITFSSSGPIIPEDQKTMIFEKYTRVDGKKSQYSKGLGLFFCKMVMAAHQGRIWLDTDEVGNYFRLGFKKF
jgi:K+-sensing histidine kinase KdpD